MTVMFFEIKYYNIYFSKYSYFIIILISFNFFFIFKIEFTGMVTTFLFLSRIHLNQHFAHAGSQKPSGLIILV